MIAVPAALILALMQVESGGVDDAVGDGGRALGCLQITYPVIADVNRILKRSFTLRDALDKPTAVFICQTYLKYWGDPARVGHDPSAEDLARIWNGGPRGFEKDATDHYWAKVKTELLVQGAFDLITVSEPPESPPEDAPGALPSDSPAS